MKHTELQLSGTKLVFERDGKDWCRMLLKANGKSIELGADTWAVIKQKLKGTLSSICESTEPEWVLNLSEKHCSLYRQNINNHTEFFWQNAEGNEIWRAEVKVPLGTEELGALC